MFYEPFVFFDYCVRMHQEARPPGGADIKKFKSHFSNSMKALPDVCESEHIILVEGKDLTEVSQGSKGKGIPSQYYVW